MGAEEEEGIGTLSRQPMATDDPCRLSLESTSLQRDFVVADGYSQTWRATIAWSWTASMSYLIIVGLVMLFLPSDPVALAEARAEVPTLVYEVSASAFFTAMCLNLTSFLFEDSAAKRQLALLCILIKGVAAHADLVTLLGWSGIFYGPEGYLVSPIRIAQWLITTPTMVFILSKITTLSNYEIASTIVVDIFLIMGGLMASISVAPYSFVFFGACMFAFIYVMWMMARMTWNAVREHDTLVARRSLTMTLYGTLFCWSMFPVAWLLPRVIPGTRPRVSELINVAGNFLSKVLLSSSMIHGNYIAISEKDKLEVRKHMLAMRSSLSALQGEHAKLIRNQEVLQAELDIALRNYVPLAVIDEGTPADKMLQVISTILTGATPTLDDVMYVRNAIMESKDIYMPVNLTSQLQTSQLDEDVSHSLLAQLMGRRRGVATASTAADGLPISSIFNPLRPGAGAVGEDGADAGVNGGGAGDDHFRRSLEDDNRGYASLQAALASILGTKMPAKDEVAAEAAAAAAAAVAAVAAVAAAAEDGEEAGDGAECCPELEPLRGEGEQATRSGRKLVTTVAARSSGRNTMGVLLEGMQEDGSEGAHASPSPSLVLDVERVLKSVRHWQFDAFALCEASQGHPLSTLGYFLFHESGLIKHFSIQGAVLARFLRCIEEGYADNPYHNRSHASDVLQSMHVLLHGGGLVPGYADPLTLMACYLAAIVHDYEHVGKTNDFLIGSNDELALRYNDRAPLENHHLSAAFTVLRDPNCNFLKHLQRGDLDRLRKTIIELVLGTDMKQHFAIISQFNTLHRASGTSTPGTRRQSTQSGRPSTDLVESPQSLVASDPAFDGNGEVRLLTPTDEAERMLGLQMALKCADLGHIAAKLVVHLKWVSCLEAEFFAQGDSEVALGMPVSPLFDRSKPGVSKSQIGFFDVVTIPLFRSFTGVFPGAKPMLTYVLRNYQYWEQKSH